MRGAGFGLFLGVVSLVAGCGDSRNFNSAVENAAGEAGADAASSAEGGAPTASGGAAGTGGSLLEPDAAGAAGEGGAPEQGDPATCDEDEFLVDGTCEALTACGDDEFEQSAPGPDQDRVCAPLSECTTDEYEKTAPTATTNRECSPLTVCAAGTFVGSAPTAQTDRVCNPCATGTFSSTLNAEACSAWSTCPSGQTQSVEPSPVSDRVCSSCGAGKYESNGGCVALTVCKSSEYQESAPTATSDRVCKALTTCAAGSRQTAAPTATTDRQCAPCSSGTFSAQTNATSCTAWTQCGADEYETQSPSLQKDRACKALTTCAAGTRIKTAATATSDRVCESCSSGTFTASANLNSCQTWRNCSAGFFATSGSATKDRACTACSNGTFSTTQNAASCQPWKTCSSNQTQTVAGTSTSDVVCVDKPVCSTAPGRTCTVDCPCPGGEGVCTASNQCSGGAVCVSDGGKKFGRSGGTCLAPHCNNDKKDSTETSVDCGGECGCRATFEVVSYSSVPSGAKLASLMGMSGDGTRFAAELGRSRDSYPAVVDFNGRVTELENYGKTGSVYGISADGNVVIGGTSCANPPLCSDTTWSQARWTGSAGPTTLGSSGTLKAVSATGSYVAGNVFDTSADATRGFLQGNNQLTVIPTISFAMGITRDGKYIAGTLVAGGIGLWLASTGAITKIQPAPTWNSASITAVSGTSPVIIGEGYINATDTRVGYRWKGGVLTDLGTFTDGRYARPAAVSVDGTTVVGTLGLFPPNDAFIWTDSGKLRTLFAELEARGYEPPGDLLLKTPKFISDDGKTIVGVETPDPPTFWRVILD